MSNLDDTDVDADKGGDAGDSSTPEEVAGLKKALSAARQTNRDRDIELAELRGRDAGRKEVKVEPTREFTRAELQAQVDDGRMTPDESDRILETQMEKRVEANVTKNTETSNKIDQQASRIQAEFKKYKEARPDIWVEGTADRELVAAEYNRQVNDLGKPPNEATELDAMATMFGSPDRLQNGKDKPAQTFQETGGAGEDGGDSKDTAPKLPGHVKAHYEKMIGMGMYSGWDDEKLKKEIDPAGYGARWT